MIKYSRLYFTALLSLFVISCKSPSDSKRDNLLHKGVVISNTQQHEFDYLVKDSIVQRLTIEANVAKEYANLSVFANDKRLVDNLALPKKGRQTVDVLLNFDALGPQHIEIQARSSEVKLKGLKLEPLNTLSIPSFKDHSKAALLATEATFKYGGPSIGDIDSDGDLDFVLNNHNHVPTQLVTNLGNGRVTIESLFDGKPDLHGSALGDYDLDGDLDIVVAHGGANGTNPTSYTLFENNNMVFTKVNDQAGIRTPARGRAPRWVDLENDGDLDLIFFNAQTPNYNGPQTLFLLNQGDGTFIEQTVAKIQSANASKALIVDFDRDGFDDILMYYPDAATLWRNNGDLSFTDVSKSWFPDTALAMRNINAVSDLDVNNDGLVDLYFANGRSHYSLSRKSIDFAPMKKKLDINDDGERGRTKIRFSAQGNLSITNAKFVFRQYREGFPLFLGLAKTPTYIQPHDYHKNDNRYPGAMESAPHNLIITPEQALGWPSNREENGIYIGYLGDNKWQAEWVRNKTLYWAIEFSISGVDDVSYDWLANNRNVQDTLLVNTGNGFVDASERYHLPQGGNHWGVSRGDFNNDGWVDLFIHRYGYLKERVADLILLNHQGQRFESLTSHGAFDPQDKGHGDMGQVFDFDQDGRLDMLNGSEDRGKWYLYLNDTDQLGHYIQFQVGYSPKHNIDPLSAEVTIETMDGKRYFRTVGSSGEAHSQSVINTVHFGLSKALAIRSATVTWRNGEQQFFGELQANQLYVTEHYH